MAENETSKAKSEETGQDNTAKKGYRITYVRECIEILASSIALIAPTMLLILWVYRSGICRFYGIPIFYSSLNIVRILPAIIIGVILVTYYGIMKITDPVDLISVEFSNVSKKNEGNEGNEEEQTLRICIEKKQKRNIDDKEIRKRLFSLLTMIRFPLFFITPFLLITEASRLFLGKSLLFYTDGDQSEPIFVLLFAIAVTVGFFTVLYKAIMHDKILDRTFSDSGFYISRRLKNRLIRVSFMKQMALPLKYVVHLAVGYWCICIISAIWYSAIVFSYFKTNYYLLNFHNAQYAVVLDTDDYYIGEPIEITQLENDRKLLIHTGAYIYLDKAENPIIVKKESFNSVTIVRE